ncbi:MAG: hypothetical protein GY862_26865 [Gammaproteobacteria bacterium]|nr:hypothetical protein [Gammaproteobacteria bacterium]MCP5013815.1 hypothetical protein [Ketobacter sp.]
MSDDIARLGIAVDSKSARKASADLDGLTSSAEKTERQTNKLSPEFKKTSYTLADVSRETKKASKEIGFLSDVQKDSAASSSSMALSSSKLIAPLVSLTASVVALNSAFEAVKTFERYESQLVTATGSIERAGLEIEALNRFAASTPFKLSEVVDAFVRLKNLGLDPSEEALTSYGNTAASMGKSLNQLIEAVADATVGEFERLKEFGIKTRSEGDSVAFTFAGVTTTVKNSSSEIQGYLRGLGETAFSGAMERRTDDLEVAFSNLGIASDRLANKLSNESGLTGAAKDAANAITSLFNSFTGAPRSVDVVESEIDRLKAALEAAASPRGGANLRSQLSDLKRELQLSRSISSDSSDVGKAIDTLDEQIKKYKTTLAEFGGEAPEERVGTRRGSRKNPAFERYESANTQLEAALNQRKALLERKAELDAEEDPAETVEFKGKLTGLTEEQLSDRIDKVRQSLHTEEEAIADSFVRRQETLADYLAANGDFEQEYRDLTISNVEDYNSRMLALDKKRTDEQIKLEADAERKKTQEQKTEQQRRLQLQRAYTSLASSIIYAFFGESKDARKAQALISTYQAADDALASGIPPPGNIAMAAAVTIAGLKNVSMIESTNIGSGGGGSSAGSVGAIPTTFNTPVISQVSQIEEQQRPVQVIFNGNVTGLNEDVLTETIADLFEREYIKVSS